MDWGSKDSTVVNMIMLRFRPIAPKPETGCANSALACLESSDSGGGKRRVVDYRRGRRNRRNARVKKANHYVNVRQSMPAVGIQGYCNVVDARPEKKSQELARGRKEEESCRTGLELTSVEKITRNETKKVTVETRVLVERIMIPEAVVDATVAVDDLNKEPCPVFVTDDRVRKVQWVNEAYKKMATEAAGVTSSIPEVTIEVWAKEGFVRPATSFTCWVRLEGSCPSHPGRTWTRTVPCDVWRMQEFAGWLAWKMDITAALGLGL